MVDLKQERYRIWWHGEMGDVSGVAMGDGLVFWGGAIGAVKFAN